MCDLVYCSSIVIMSYSFNPDEKTEIEELKEQIGELTKALT